MLREILQQARHIEAYHLRHETSEYTRVSRSDARHMQDLQLEGGNVPQMVATLLTTEEDVASGSFVTEMTGEGELPEAVRTVMAVVGNDEDMARDVLSAVQQS